MFELNISFSFVPRSYSVLFNFHLYQDLNVFFVNLEEAVQRCYIKTGDLNILESSLEKMRNEILF